MISFRKRVQKSFTFYQVSETDKELRSKEFIRIQSIIRSVRTDEQLEPLLVLIDKFRDKHLDMSLCDVLLKEFRVKRDYLYNQFFEFKVVINSNR
jgi:hypothetical protein